MRKFQIIFTSHILFLMIFLSSLTLVGGSEGKESACNGGDLGSIPELGRSLGEGNGNPLQYSCLENLMDRGAWQTTVHGVAKSQTWLSDWACMHARSPQRTCREPWSARGPTLCWTCPQAMASRPQLSHSACFISRETIITWFFFPQVSHLVITQTLFNILLNFIVFCKYKHT